MPPARRVHYLTLILGALFLFFINREQWFFGDEWEFLTDRGINGADLSLLQPHNEHWSTVPILVYRLLFGVFGVQTYWPYIAVLICLHIGVTHVLWRLMLASGSSTWAATVAAMPFVVLGAGAENLLWAFQIGFVGSLFLGLLQIALVDHDGPTGRRDAIALGAAVFSLMFSGMSIPMVAVACLTLLLRRRFRRAVIHGLTPAIIYVGWVLTAGRAGFGSTFSPNADPLTTTRDYVWHGISAVFETLTGFEGTTLVIILVLSAWWLTKISALQKHTGALACAAGVPILFGTLSLGRAGLGIEQAASGRYVYFAVALLLPTVALILSDLEGNRLLLGIGVSIGITVTVRGGFLLDHAAAIEATRETAVRGQILAAAEIQANGGPILDQVPEPVYTPDLQMDELELFLAGDKLKVGGPISPIDRLRAIAQVQLSATGAPAFQTRGSAPILLAPVRAQIIGSSGDCATLIGTDAIPQVVIGIVDRTSIAITFESAGDMDVHVSDDSTGLVAEPSNFPVPPGEEFFLNIGAAGIQPIIDLDETGKSTICGVRQAHDE